MEKSNCRRETGDGKMQTGNGRTENRKSRPPKSPNSSWRRYQAAAGRETVLLKNGVRIFDAG